MFGQIVSIQVATHFLRWRHRAIEVQIGTLGEVSRHHTHLDVTCNTQVALNTLLRRRCLLQLVVGRQQFLVGFLQLVVSLLQTACSYCAEHDKRHHCHQNQSANNQHTTELLTLLFHFQALLLTL